MQISIPLPMKVVVPVPSFIRFRRLAFLVLAGGSLMACSGGCSSRGYPDVRVSSPLHKPGVCHSCGVAIAEVELSHLLNVKSVQYVVCSEKCAAEQRAWHESEFGK